MPEYGRSIQKMVDMAVQMADRAERQQCANTIVKIMSGILPATTNKDIITKVAQPILLRADFFISVGGVFI